MSDDVLVRVEGVSKKFCRSLKKSLWYGMQDLGNELRGRRHGGNGELRVDEFWAVKDVSFELKRGECLGLIGPNGAGKSTLLKMLNGLIKPDAGRIEMCGRIGALIELGAGFNPILTGRENIYVNGSVLGFGKAEIERKLDTILHFAELHEFIDMPVKNYSSGMKVRLGFAVAAQMEPDVLLIDEVLAVGDVGFKKRSLNRIFELAKNASIIFVSHSIPSVARIADKIITLEKGGITYGGPDKGAAIESYYSMLNVGRECAWGDGSIISLELRTYNQNNCLATNFVNQEIIAIQLSIESIAEPMDCRINIIFTNQMDAAVAILDSSCEPITLKKSSIIIVRSKCLFSPGKYSLDVNINRFSDGKEIRKIHHVSRIGYINVVSSRFYGDIPIQLEGAWFHISMRV